MNPRPPHLVFYVSGHGYGHATRIAALLEALLPLLAGRYRVQVRTEAPAHIFHEVSARIEVVDTELDVGLIQANGFDIDLPGSLAAHEALGLIWDQRVEREAQLLREQATALVIGDIPALGFAAARCAHVPSLAVTNFSWDWILAQYREAEPRWGAICDRYAAAYASARRLYRIPLAAELSAFGTVRDVPLLARTIRVPPAQVRNRLGIPEEDTRPLVLFSFGGMGSGPISFEQAPTMQELIFAAYEPAPRAFPGEWRQVAKDARFAHVDLMAASSLAIIKPGYSTVAEALAGGTRLLVVPRPEFREAPIIEKVLRERGGYGLLSRQDLVAGRWAAGIAELLQQEAPSPWSSLGAEVIAAEILHELDN